MRAAVFLLPGLLLAQTDWTVPAEFRAAGYTREKVEKGYALSGPGPDGAMTQTFDATPYRGAPVRLRASVRVEGAGSAQLVLRVDRNGSLGFFDNMGDRPIRTGEWKTYDLAGEVAADARTVEIGVLSTGAVTVLVDGISFEKLPPASPRTAAARAAIEASYARVDAAYARGDVDGVASLAAPGARLVLDGKPVPLSTVLSEIVDQVRKGVTFQSHSTVTALELAGDEATVWVNNRSSSGVSGILSSSRDVWLQTDSGWKLKESTLIATQPLTPPDVLAEIPRRAGMPGFQGVRIVLFDGARVPEIPGFAPVSGPGDRRAAEDRALSYLKEHAPEEAGPAALAFQGSDPAKLSTVVRSFDAHRAQTPEWLWARQSAVFVYQTVALADHPEELAAGQAIWLASQAYPNEKILIAVPNTVKVAPIVRARYGKQVYVLGGIPRELLGGDFFLDLATLPPDSAVGRWAAAQKFPFDGIVGQ
jgi:hypothetical protein